jgi:hypothetical protein
MAEHIKVEKIEHYMGQTVYAMSATNAVAVTDTGIVELENENGLVLRPEKQMPFYIPKGAIIKREVVLEGDTK